MAAVLRQMGRTRAPGERGGAKIAATTTACRRHLCDNSGQRFSAWSSRGCLAQCPVAINSTRPIGRGPPPVPGFESKGERAGRTKAFQKLSNGSTLEGANEFGLGAREVPFEHCRSLQFQRRTTRPPLRGYLGLWYLEILDGLVKWLSQESL